VLWDIDGTLMRAPGLGVRAFAAALELVTGSGIRRDHRYDFGGKTDPMIALELLQAMDLQDRADDLIPPMLAEVERVYATSGDELRGSSIVMPGVVTLLDALATAEARQSVVTGNIEFVARRKLAAVDLDERLDLDGGAYGSDHHLRAELVRLAMDRLGKAGEVDPATTWVIGDTPRDAACARDAGVRCILVATGTFDIGALGDLGADAVFADLSDTDRVLALVAGHASTVR